MGAENVKQITIPQDRVQMRVLANSVMNLRSS